MARYFYNLTLGGSPDRIGVELDTPERARAEAVRFLGEILVYEGERLWQEQEIIVAITDERGLVLWTLAVHASGSAATVALDARRG